MTRVKRNLFKPLVSSFFTGGSLSTSPNTSNGQAFGGDVMARLASDDITVRLYREIQHGMKRLIDQTPSEKDGPASVFTNAVGARLSVTGERRDFGRLSAHLLTGYEQFAVREFCGQAEGLQGIIYDGFIAKPQEAPALEDHVRRRSKELLGVTLDLRLKRDDALSDAMPNIERDEGDF